MTELDAELQMGDSGLAPWDGASCTSSSFTLTCLSREHLTVIIARAVQHLLICLRILRASHLQLGFGQILAVLYVVWAKLDKLSIAAGGNSKTKLSMGIFLLGPQPKVCCCRSAPICSSLIVAQLI